MGVGKGSAGGLGNILLGGDGWEVGGGCKGTVDLTSTRMMKMSLLIVIGANFWEGDATKHVLVKKKSFSVKRREAFSE